ncbi:la-related protein 1C isoform X1 [Capsicum galapagoense]
MATPTINHHHSHWNTTTSDTQRSSAGRDVSSSWTQVVCSGESESTVEVTSSSPPPPPASVEQVVVHSTDCEQVSTAGSASSLSAEGAATQVQVESSDSNGAKKPAWNKPSNGAGDVSPVMGAVSWPALSESTKASPKSSSDDSLKDLSGGPLSLSQGTGMASASHTQANTKNVNPNTMLNHVVPSRQRSMKRGGGNSNHNNVSANSGFSQQKEQGLEVGTVNNSGKPGNCGVGSSSRDNSHRDGGQWGFQSHGGNDHQHQRNTNRRGNVGPHPRGDGTYHHGYGGRRDQERRNQDWKPHRSWGNRDSHMEPQRGPARPFMGGPPHPSPPPPFIPTPMPGQPYRTPMVYSEVPPLFYFPGPFPDPVRMPMLSPVPPVFLHVPDPQLHTRIVNQIDYYFSNENLIKDTFLRQNMDEHGWVPVTLIAGFKKVMELTDNVQLILNAVISSTVVEVQGEKLRRRNDWFHWLMPPLAQNSSVSSSQSQKKPILVENLRRLAFDDKAIRHENADAHLSRSSSTELSTLSKQHGDGMTGLAGVQHSQPMPVGNPN